MSGLAKNRPEPPYYVKWSLVVNSDLPSFHWATLCIKIGGKWYFDSGNTFQTWWHFMELEDKHFWNYLMAVICMRS